MQKLLIILLLAAIAVISCNKQGPDYPTVKPAPKRLFTANYQAFDSSYTLVSSGSGSTTATQHYNYSKVLSILMDSAANYIVVDKDTFKWNEQYADFKGYYSFFSSPIDNNQVVLTQDSIKLFTNRQLSNHTLAMGSCIGYRK